MDEILNSRPVPSNRAGKNVQKGHGSPREIVRGQHFTFILVIGHAFANFALAAAAIPIVLVARVVSVALPIGLLSLTGLANRNAIPILTWGGLRGGISVALALSLPASEYKNALLSATYAVVVFSILVQGLTVERLVRALLGEVRQWRTARRWSSRPVFVSRYMARRGRKVLLREQRLSRVNARPAGKPMPQCLGKLVGSKSKACTARQ